MKRLFLAFSLGALLALPQIAAADEAKADQQVVFSDGTKALTYDHCGDTDICALLLSPNGDRLSIYSEGAAYCQPYLLHFVKTNHSRTIFEYSRTINHDLPTNTGFGPHCGNSRDTQMVMDHGLIHMTVTENHDGTLSVVFTPTKQGTMRRQADTEGADPSDGASPSPKS